MYKKKAGFHQFEYSCTSHVCTSVYTCAAGITQPKWPNKVILFQKCTSVIVWTREIILLSNGGLVKHLIFLNCVVLNSKVKDSEVISEMN